MTIPAGLSTDQQLTYLVGDVVRLNASVTATARTIYRELHRALGYEFNGSYDFSELHEKALSILGDSGFAPEVVTAGTLTLDCAYTAHNHTLGLVEALWREDDQLSDAWVRRVEPHEGRPLPAATQGLIDAFAGCRESLIRSEHQLSAFVFLIPATEFDYDNIEKLDATNMAIATGDFALDASEAAVPNLA
jgi:hypothetical protein